MGNFYSADHIAEDHILIDKTCNIEDGWMTCDFTSFSIDKVFQSFQDDERLVMKGCVQWSSVYG